MRAVVLAGDGPSFSAGADINWMRAAMSLDVEGNEQDAMAMADMFETIDTCPVPGRRPGPGRRARWRDGAVRGSDLVIAESGTRFGFTETRLGILPAVISPFVIAKIGETTPGRCSPAAAASMPSVPSGSGSSTRSSRARRRSIAAVDAAVARHARRGPTAARAAKAIVREVRGLGHGSSKWHTARVIARQRVSEEAREGFAAFDEKRPPAWVPDDSSVIPERPGRRRCIGCGRIVPDIDGPDPPVSSRARPGCWARLHGRCRSAGWRVRPSCPHSAIDGRRLRGTSTRAVPGPSVDAVGLDPPGGDAASCWSGDGRLTASIEIRRTVADAQRRLAVADPAGVDGRRRRDRRSPRPPSGRDAQAVVARLGRGGVRRWSDHHAAIRELTSRLLA